PGGRAAPAAENAGDIEFDRRLGERKIAGPEARLDARAEKLLHKIFDGAGEIAETEDRKSTRLNSSHVAISYAVFCLKKKNKHLLSMVHACSSLDIHSCLPPPFIYYLYLEVLDAQLHPCSCISPLCAHLPRPSPSAYH